MIKYIITGGAGFIGSNLVDYLLEQGHQVVCVDNESAESNSQFYWSNARALLFPKAFWGSALERLRTDLTCRLLVWGWAYRYEFNCNCSHIESRLASRILMYVSMAGHSGRHRAVGCYLQILRSVCHER